jgi:hypothetical protein
MEETAHFAVLEYDHLSILGFSVERFWAQGIHSFYRPFYQEPY